VNGDWLNGSGERNIGGVNVSHETISEAHAKLGLFDVPKICCFGATPMFHMKHSPNLHHAANPVRFKGQPQVSGFADDAWLEFHAVPRINVACTADMRHCQSFVADASPIGVVKRPDGLALALKLVGKHPADERRHQGLASVAGKCVGVLPQDGNAFSQNRQRLRLPPKIRLALKPKTIAVEEHLPNGFLVRPDGQVANDDLQHLEVWENEPSQPNRHGIHR